MNADMEEVTFWTSLEAALSQIRHELSLPPILLTLALLKRAKRFLATMALENNTGLVAAENHTSDVTNFLKYYPVEELILARVWDAIANGMEGTVRHVVSKVRQSRFYSLERVCKLVEAGTLTLRQRMFVVLRESCGVVGSGNSGRLWGMEFGEYEEKVYHPTQDIFVRLDAVFQEFTEFVMEQGRRRRVSDDPSSSAAKTPAQLIKSLTLYHLVLRERLEAIHHFRMQHEKLRLVVTKLLSGE